MNNILKRRDEQLMIYLNFSELGEKAAIVAGQSHEAVLYVHELARAVDDRDVSCV